MAETRKRSSVIGFIAVGVVIAALVVGGAYFIRQQTAPKAQPSKVADTPQKDTPKEETSKKSDEPKPELPSAPAPRQPKAKELPQGGPADFALTLVAAVLLAGAGVSYMRSRRPELSL